MGKVFGVVLTVLLSASGLKPFLSNGVFSFFFQISSFINGGVNAGRWTVQGSLKRQAISRAGLSGAAGRRLGSRSSLCWTSASAQRRPSVIRSLSCIPFWPRTRPPLSAWPRLLRPVPCRGRVGTKGTPVVRRWSAVCFLRASGQRQAAAGRSACTLRRSRSMSGRGLRSPPRAAPPPPPHHRYLLGRSHYASQTRTC